MLSALFGGRKGLNASHIVTDIALLHLHTGLEYSVCFKEQRLRVLFA